MQSNFNSLEALGWAALHDGRALAEMADGRSIPVLSKPLDHSFDLKGLRAGPGVEAVAFTFGWFDGRPTIAIAVSRSGELLIFTRPGGVPAMVSEPTEMMIDQKASLVVDIARRIMGLPTDPPPSTITELYDTLWLDRMVETCLASPIGEPPPMQQLTALHPNAEQRPVTAEMLGCLRRVPHLNWYRFHASACDHGVTWAGIGPAMASWFDTGSLARWLFAMLPEPTVMLDELVDLIPAADYRSICEVLERAGSQ